jgi:hypothetical protein
VTILVRFVLASLLLNRNAFFFRNFLAILIRFLVALGELLFHYLELLDWKTFGLRKLLAGFR